VPEWKLDFNGLKKMTSMKKNYRKATIILMMLMLLSSGCRDNFLNLVDPNELSAETFWTNMPNIENSVTGAYDAVKCLDLFGQTFYIQTLLALPHESDYWNAQNRNAVTSIDGNVEIAWRALYRIVARTNDIIGHIPGYTASYHPDATDAARLIQIDGEARFLRAIAYFHLVRLWGEATFSTDSTKLAVPLILNLATTTEALQVKRASVGRIYNQIVGDFKAAETELPATWDSNNIARATSFSAKGFLGQVYLYMGDNNNAKTYFEEILNNAAYSLVSNSDYRDLFQGKHEFSSESLFEINYTVDMAQNIWENGLGSGIALVIAPPGRGWSNCTPHGVNVRRFGKDPRLKIAMFAPTDSALDVNGILDQCGKSTFNYTGHSFKKYNPVDYCVYSTNRDSGINYFLLRLADIYLMYAEVMNNLNNNTVAAEYMNKVRRRAYGFDPNNPQPAIDYTVSGTQLRDSIREERFRELFAEGHRWYDIVRWDIVQQEVLKYNTLNVTQGPIVYEDKIRYYPVPQSEVDTNHEIIPSTGY
jgi:starch-binding outer membrane protein, SusD/RagB family